MGSFGSWMDATISANTQRTPAIDLGSEYDYLVLLIPGMDKCKLWLEVAEQESSTYYELGKGVATDEENFNRSDIWRLGGCKYIKIVSSVVQKTAVTIRLRGWRM